MTGNMISIEVAIARDSDHFEFRSVEIEPPSDNEILVRIAAVGICHTDLDCASGGSNIVLGHEGAGIVERIGRKIKTLRPGDHVVLSYQSCGCCPACRRGQPAHCDDFFRLNFSGERLDGTNALETSGLRAHFFGQSSFATHAIATERNTVKVPRTLPLAQLAPLGCGIQTGAGTILNSLDVRAHQSVAIFGTGSVGLAAVMAARIRRAAPLIAIDIQPKRLRLARQLGATHTLDARRKDLTTALRQIAPRGIDYALEITGDSDNLRTAIETLAPRGTIAMIANPCSGDNRLKAGQKMLEIIQGDAVPQRFIPRLIRYHRAGRFPLQRLNRTYPFHQINRAIADTHNGRAIKPVLLLSTTNPTAKPEVNIPKR